MTVVARTWRSAAGARPRARRSAVRRTVDRHRTMYGLRNAAAALTLSARGERRCRNHHSLEASRRRGTTAAVLEPPCWPSGSTRTRRRSLDQPGRCCGGYDERRARGRARGRGSDGDGDRRRARRRGRERPATAAEATTQARHRARRAGNQTVGLALLAGRPPSSATRDGPTALGEATSADRDPAARLATGHAGSGLKPRLRRRAQHGSPAGARGGRGGAGGGGHALDALARRRRADRGRRATAADGGGSRVERRRTARSSCARAHARRMTPATRAGRAGARSSPDWACTCGCRGRRRRAHARGRPRGARRPRARPRRRGRGTDARCRACRRRASGGGHPVAADGARGDRRPRRGGLSSRESPSAVLSVRTVDNHLHGSTQLGLRGGRPDPAPTARPGTTAEAGQGGPCRLGPL